MDTYTILCLKLIQAILEIKRKSNIVMIIHKGEAHEKRE